MDKEKSQSEPVFMSLPIACKYLNLKPATLYSYNLHRIIPFYRRRGRKVYYMREDLDNFILNNTTLVKSSQQIETEACTRIVTGK